MNKATDDFLGAPSALYEFIDGEVSFEAAIHPETGEHLFPYGVPDTMVGLSGPQRLALQYIDSDLSTRLSYRWEKDREQGKKYGPQTRKDTGKLESNVKDQQNKFRKSVEQDKDINRTIGSLCRALAQERKLLDEEQVLALIREHKPSLDDGRARELAAYHYHDALRQTQKVVLACMLIPVGEYDPDTDWMVQNPKAVVLWLKLQALYPKQFRKGEPIELTRSLVGRLIGCSNRAQVGRYLQALVNAKLLERVRKGGLTKDGTTEGGLYKPIFHRHGG